MLSASIRPYLGAVLSDRVYGIRHISTPVDAVASPRRETLLSLSDPTRIERRFAARAHPRGPCGDTTCDPAASSALDYERSFYLHARRPLYSPRARPKYLAWSLWDQCLRVFSAEFEHLMAVSARAFFVSGRLFEYVPLVLNCICLWATIGVICRIFRDLPIVSRVLVVGSIAVSLNLYGLVFVGMEHGLQDPARDCSASLPLISEQRTPPQTDE